MPFSTEVFLLILREINPLKTFFYSFVFLLLGLLLGVVWANRYIQTVGNNDAITLHNGVWTYFASMDLAKNDLQRAFIGRIGLFALKDSEAIYYIANQDEEGHPLSAENKYVIQGNTIDAAYWSITLYGEDHFLLPSEEKRFSFNQANIQYNDSLKQHYIIQLGGKSKDYKNHLPVEGKQRISLLLRIYKPSNDVYDNRDLIQLPKIKRIDL